MAAEPRNANVFGTVTDSIEIPTEDVWLATNNYAPL